jgi:release factor H-coupled RctB family protein
VEDEEAAGAMGLTADNVYICVHSGSRGYGESILSAHSKQHGGTGLLSVRNHNLVFML